jgi:ATP-dependent helicase HrpB
VAGRNTRIEVVTEGILTRLLQAAPDLPGVALVIFDEFHERSIHADLGLALTLDVQDHLREDLRILVMSATLDGVSLSRVLGDVPVVLSGGRSHPVETRYLSYPWQGSIEREAARVIRRALGETEGDILVFLPGGFGKSAVPERCSVKGGLPDDVVTYTSLATLTRKSSASHWVPFRRENGRSCYRQALPRPVSRSTASGS